MAKLIEIRILPPIAIARLGGSKIIAENYELVEDEEWEKDGFRSLKFAETVTVDKETGATTVSDSDEKVKQEDFKDGGDKVKPVAPFLEVWGVFEDKEDKLVPLTPEKLGEAGYTIDDFEWTVNLANRKMSRRTGDDKDVISLVNDQMIKEVMIVPANHHKIVELWARSDNFSKPEAKILLGKAQSLAHEEGKPLKLRFIPGEGKVYQHEAPAEGEVNRGQIELAGQWPTYSRTDLDPLPGGLIEAGMFDDSCDGVISVRVKGNDALRSNARVSSGPPDYSPDTQFIRSIDDEMEQIIYGVDVKDIDYPDDDEGNGRLINDIVDIVQRASDTMRMANPAGMVRWWIGEDIPNGWQDRLQYQELVNKHVQQLHDIGNYRNKPLTPDEKYRLSTILEGLSSRLRTRTDINIAPDANAWLMPFLMRGSDGDFVILSERQRNKIKNATQRFAKYAPESALARLKNEIWAQAERAADDSRVMHLIVVDSSGQVNLLDVFKEVFIQKKSGIDMEQSGAVGRVVDLIRNGVIGGVKLIDWDKLVKDGSLNTQNAPITNFMGNMSQPIKEAIVEWINSEAAILRILETEPSGFELAPSKREGAPAEYIPIDRSDIMSQLRYKAFGNPPSTLISSTISNCFPGLEMDFRGVWQRLLRDDVDSSDYQYDWVLHETYNAVLLHGEQTFVGQSRIGLIEDGGDVVQFSADDYQDARERQNDRFNRLSRLIHENPRDAKLTLEFRGRTFDVRLNELVDESTGYIKRPKAGELTHGLCSPWQRDFRDCGCVYWSANRPDFVNVDTDSSGASTGKNWMSEDGQMNDSGNVDPDDEYNHKDLYDNWQSKLEFVVKGQTKS